jgi:hypothetical protein
MEPLGVLAFILVRACRTEESFPTRGKLQELVRLSCISAEWLLFPQCCLLSALHRFTAYMLLHALHSQSNSMRTSCPWYEMVRPQPRTTEHFVLTGKMHFKTSRPSLTLHLSGLAEIDKEIARLKAAAGILSDAKRVSRCFQF